MAGATPDPYPATWRFHNEEEWLVGQTVDAIAGVVLFASGRSEPPSIVVSVKRAPLSDPLDPRRFAVRFAPGVSPVSEIDLHIDDYIWSPDAYAVVARKLGGLQARAADARPQPSTTNLPASLLDLRIETLERENRRISEGLATDPLDPSLHQEAALLLAAFALRETGRHFGDRRVALCRLAAHLALARLGGGDATTNPGRLAEIALDALAARQKAALERLAAFTPASKAEEAWSRALHLETTGDWRALHKPEQASLLERIVYARTLTERLDSNRAQDFLDRAAPENVTDWRRLMLGVLGDVTIESCNRYTGWGVAADESEVLAVWRAHRGTDLEPEDWVDALGMNPALSPASRERFLPEKFHVIDLGLWMAFERRQVLTQLRWDDRCLTRGYGLYAQGRALRKSLAVDYGRLEVYPLIAREHSVDPASHASSMAAAAELVRRRPDLVTALEWVDLSDATPFGPPAKELPRYALWFDSYCPFGTAFDAINRTTNVPFKPLRATDFKVVPAAEAEMAPYHYELRWRLCQSRSGPASDPRFDVIEPIYRELAEYDAWALKALMKAAEKESRDDQYRRYASRLCEFSVDSCGALADWLVKRGEDEEAAKAYRKWAAGARDRVAVSNDIWWLVNYDREHGRREEAFRIARDAASVYSAGGLVTLALLQERTGDLKGAEQTFRRAYDRYETDSQFLIGFYRRHADDPKVQPGMVGLEREIFPGGLARARFSLPETPPSDGVLIVGSSPAVVEAGLQPGNVIVGLDGYRVRNLHQYNWVRFLASLDAPMDLKVWAGSQIKDVRAHPKERWFYADFENYRPENP